jgi:Flp pilus assembly pilin Flp
LAHIFFLYSWAYNSSAGFSKVGRARSASNFLQEAKTMIEMLGRMWSGDEGQDIAEYAVILAVILVIVVGTIRLIGSNANNVFSTAASSLQ